MMVAGCRMHSHSRGTEHALSSGESEIASSAIGGMVMEALKGLDAVAYVRFASVYRDFREAGDFQDVLTEIAKDVKDAGTPPAIPEKN